MTALGNHLCQESGWPKARGKKAVGGRWRRRRAAAVAVAAAGVEAPSTDWASGAGSVTSLGLLVKHSKQRGKCLNGSLCYGTT